VNGLLAAVPLWLSVLAGVLGGIVFVGVHGFAGWLTTSATWRTRYRTAGLIIATVLVLLGLGVGTVLSYNATANAVAAEIGVGKCGPA